MSTTHATGEKVTGTTDEPLTPGAYLSYLVTKTTQHDVLPAFDDEHRGAVWAIQDTIERVGEVA